MWKKITDLLNHPVIQLVGGTGLIFVITWIFTHLAKLPVWEIWLAMVFAVGCGLWIVNQISIWRELHRRGLTKLPDAELENTVRKWLDNPGMTITRLPDVEQAYFGFAVEYTDNKTKIIVTRLKSERERQYLAIQGLVSIHSSEGVELSEAEAIKISRRIGLEMARANIYFTVESIPNGRKIRFHNWVPIYDGLNASFFSDECLSVTKGIMLARYVLADVLEELGKAMQPISRQEDSEGIMEA